MSSAERPEADVAEQSLDAEGYDDRQIGPGSTFDVDGSAGDVLEQMQDAGPSDEDEARRSG